jgi:hypothetical protein
MNVVEEDGCCEQKGLLAGRVVVDSELRSEALSTPSNGKSASSSPLVAA